ncbi:energy transducer TonB [Rubrivivax rivuli]|uniref:TonB family protein n=1 Tax=Rubrivivax rivuli TaxID=1862385 RepID=A0A437RJX1_9BURK|nr:TonB family protein [Rubrivivax rivuli]RVU47076.1 TonB family protein [Rubrivivax rivuli]
MSFRLGNSGFVCEEPFYPAAAMRAGAQGKTTVRYTVTEPGLITDVVVQVSAGDSREHKLLDRSAVRLVQSCKYKASGPPTLGTFTFEQRWFIS